MQLREGGAIKQKVLCENGDDGDEVNLGANIKYFDDDDKSDGNDDVAMASVGAHARTQFVETALTRLPLFRLLVFVCIKYSHQLNLSNIKPSKSFDEMIGRQLLDKNGYVTRDY